MQFEEMNKLYEKRLEERQAKIQMLERNMTNQENQLQYYKYLSEMNNIQ